MPFKYFYDTHLTYKNYFINTDMEHLQIGKLSKPFALIVH